MRVQLGTDRDRAARIVYAPSGPILLLYKEMITVDLVQRLDGLLQGFQPYDVRRVRLHRYDVAARALDVSERWLKTRVAAGEVPYHMVGGYVRFTADDIERIRAGMRRGGGQG